MDFETANEANKKWLRNKFKNLSEDEIAVKAKEMTDKYITDNLEKIDNEQAKNKKLFDESVDKEFRYLDLFGDD